MKHKFLISKNDKKNTLTIKEFSDVEKPDIYYLLCEESYSVEAIESAISKGKEALILTLRTINLYPSRLYAEKIAGGVIDLYNSRDRQFIELFFDDKESIIKDWKKPEDVEDIKNDVLNDTENESTELNDLIGDDHTIKEITSSTKSEDDDKLIDIKDEN